MPNNDPILRVRPGRLIDDQKRKQAAVLFAHDIGYRRVADMLGLSVFTVRDWARQWRKGKFNVEASRKLYTYTEEFKREVVELRLSGMTWKQLERETGISPATCRRWISQFGAQEALKAPDDTQGGEEEGKAPKKL